MRYQVFIDCATGEEEAYPWPEYDSLSEIERQRKHELASQEVGAFYAGDWEADSPEAAIAMAVKWIEDDDVFVFPGA